MKILRPLLLALCLAAFSSMAVAHDHDDHDRHDHHGWQSQRGHDHYHHDRRHDYRWHDRYVIHHDAPRHHWRRGYRYGGPVYVVHDYSYRHLRRPPRGYRWVRASNNDYLLVALTTGIILDIATR